MPSLGLLDAGLADAIKKAAPKVTTSTPTVTSAQSAYETRTGDLGNVVSQNSYTQPTVAPITAPVVQPQVAPAPATTATPVVTKAPAADPADTVTPPSPTEAAVDDYQNTTLARFTAADIEAALAAIEAEFGLTREQLLGDQTMIGAQYRLLTAQLARQQAKALEGAEAGALQRGLFRSGIFAAEAGDIGQQFGEAQAQAAQQKQSQELQISNQLATLGAAEAAAKAAEETAIRRGEYTARLAAAGL